MARYLEDHRRVVLEYKYGGGVVGYGFRRMRENSEINIRRRSHVRFALPEDVQPDAGDNRFIFWEVGSEFYGIVRAATMGIGIKSTFKELGLEVEVQVNTDSSAARSISSRRCAGRVRHVEVRDWWVQERICRGEVSIIKVRGEDNFAKHVERSKMEMYMEKCGFARREGRHELCPHLGIV